MKLKVFIFFYCFLLFLLCFSVFDLLRPFFIIDHNTSQITCLKDQRSYKLGPNLIAVFGEKPDNFVDKNIRKLCEYNILQDYQDSYKTPPTANYRFSPVFQEISSLADALLFSTVLFIIGLVLLSLLTKHAGLKLSKRPLFFVLSGILCLMMYIAIMRPFLAPMRCKLIIAHKVDNFKKSAYGFGLERIKYELSFVQKTLNQLYENCRSI